jgi:hypothetical protein
MRVLLLLLALTAGAAIAQDPVTELEPAAPLAQVPVVRIQFPVTDIAQAYTGPATSNRVTVEPWDESGPTLGDNLGTRVDYFTVTPAPIMLTSGQSFELSELVVTAYGLNGSVVESAPLKLSLEAPPDVVSLERAVETQRLLAIRRGIGRLWIESQLLRGTGTGERYRLPVVILVK